MRREESQHFSSRPSESPFARLPTSRSPRAPLRAARLTVRPNGGMNVRRLFTQENRLAEKKGNCGFRSLKRLPVARLLLLQLTPENVSIHGTGPLRLKWTEEKDFPPTFLSRDNRAAAEWTTHNATLRRDNLPRPICRRAATAAFVSPDASPFFRCCLPPSYETGAANFTMECFLLKNLPTDEPTHAYVSTHRFKPKFW